MSERIARRSSFWSSRLVKLTFVGLVMAFAACAADVGDESFGTGDDQEVGELRAGQTNLCIGQPANTFICRDDTQFQHCVGDDRVFVNNCPAGLCATRSPANQNPCVGKALAAQLDGVQPPAANAGAVTPAPAPANGGQVNNQAPANNNGGVQCNADGTPGPKFDVNGTKNLGNGQKLQFIGGQCLSEADCASGCCAKPCGICSGPGAQFQAGKQGCGFVDGNIGRPVAQPAPAPAPAPVVNNNNNGAAGGTADGRLPPRDGRTNLRSQFLDQVRQGVDGSQNVGLGTGKQFITGQCFSNADCAANGDGTPTAGCARRAAKAPVRTQFEGVCSGLAVCGAPGAPVNNKEGCGFDQRLGR
jgi:hypothetical protein